MNKNPWFRFDQKPYKHLKPQILKNVKISKKMHEKCKKMKKKGQKSLTLSVLRKPLTL